MSFFTPRLYFRYAIHAAFVVVVLTGLSPPANAESFDATNFGFETSDDPPLEFSPVIAGAQVLGATAFGGAAAAVLVMATSEGALGERPDQSRVTAFLIAPLVILVPALVGSVVGAYVGSLFRGIGLPPKQMEQLSAAILLRGLTGAAVASGVSLVLMAPGAVYITGYLGLLLLGIPSGNGPKYLGTFLLIGGGIAAGASVGFGVLGSLVAAGVPVEE